NIHRQDRAHVAGQISLGDRTVGSPAGQGGRGGAGQQDGADCLGGAGQGRNLSDTNTLKQRSNRSSGLSARHWQCEITSRAYRNVEGDDGLMRTGWTGDRENPLLGQALSSASE